MNFQDLHELLRLELLKRIESGPLTGTSLARQAQFQQAHISNFLNRKRSLSLEGLDRVLAAQNLTVEQILPIALHAAAGSSGLNQPAYPQPLAPQPSDEVAQVPVVSSSTAMDEAIIHPVAVIETVHVSASRLQEARPRASPRHAHWQRFVAIRADAHQAAAMNPLVAHGAIVLVDRHYQSLAPCRAQQNNLYAVRCGSALALRYIEFEDGRLILRPLSHDFPIQLLTLAPDQAHADYIVGRVCLIVSEL